MSKQNTPGLGTEYEILVPAYFALVLNNNDDVYDFSIESNVKEKFGNMDDVVIVIKMKNGSIRKFAIQLKHIEKSKNLLAANFELGGNFSLEKYCKAFKSLRKHFQNYNFILYSNAKFKSARKEDVKNFNMLQNDACLGNEFFNTSCDLQNVYKFAVNDTTPDGKDVTKPDFAQFLPKFSLYTNQKNFKKLEENILDVLKSKEVYLKYVELFRKWHQGEFTNKIIDKKTLNLHLVDIFLSPFIVKNYHLSDGQNQNLELFERVVKEFDVAVIDDSFLNFKKELLECEVNGSNDIITAKNHKFLGKLAKELDEETKLKISYYFYKKPIIVDFNSFSRDLIYKTFELYNKCSGNELKFVLLGLGVDDQIPSNLKVFSNLSQIDEALLKNIIQLAQISLQGRQPVALNKIMEFCEEIIEIITPKELFFMLKSSYLIGEEEEHLVSHYTCRSISVNTVDLKVAFEHSIRNNDLLLIDFDGKFDSYRNMLEENSIVLGHIPDFTIHYFEYSYDVNVVPTKSTFSEECFSCICKANPNRKIHFFRILSKNIMALIMSSDDGTFTYEEEDIHTECDTPISIFCAQPGMGKSTLFKSLKNNCPSNSWVINVDSKTHNSYLKVKHDFQEMLNYFMEMENEEDIFLKKFKTLWLEKRRILLLLDGLDEIESKYVDNILDFVEHISSIGCRVWISSRENLQKKLENRFKIYSNKINEFSEEQQCFYVRNRLREKYEEEEIEEIVKKIFVNVANNRQILGIPLQLKIITTLFLNNRSYYENMIENDIFVLTKMYKHFFEGRFEHSLEKLESSHLHLISEDLEDRLEKYEIPALQSLFNDDIIADLNIDLRKNRRFLENIKIKKDQLGIITRIDNDNRAIFEHRTFAEYFASKFLVNNFDKARILQDHLFSDEYKNLLLIFNILLAEDNYLHLGIIYNNMDLVRKYIDDKNNKKDEGGRNVFHLIGIDTLTRPITNESLPILNTTITYNADDYEYDVYHDYIDYEYNADERKSDKTVELLDYLIKYSEADPLEKDEVFSYNALEYCLQYDCLYLAENIIANCDKVPDVNDSVWENYDEYSVACYCFRIGYPNLLRVTLGLDKTHFAVFKSLRSEEEISYEPLRNIFSLEESVKEEIVNVINNHYISRLIYDEDFFSDVPPIPEILFHFASELGDVKLMRHLLKLEVDIDSRNDHGETALHVAINYRQFDVVSFLLDRGVEINVEESNTGRTPLHNAVISKYILMVRLLVEAGADLEAKNGEGVTALALAARCGFEDGVKYLLENNAKYEANILHDVGYTLEILEIFLNKGIDINTKNNKGETVLFNTAIKPYKTQMAKFLIDNGADVTVVANDGSTVFHQATINCNVEVLKLLLEKNVEMLNVADHDGTLPLHIAVNLRNIELVRLLVEAGADLEAENKARRTALYEAARGGFDDGVNYLLEKNAKHDATILHYSFDADFRASFEIVQLFLNKGIDINWKNDKGETVLFHGVIRPSVNGTEIVRLLIDKGADVTVVANNGRTVFHEATVFANVEVLKLLLEKNVEMLNVSDHDGTSPLHIAVYSKNVECVELFLKKGIDLERIVIDHKQYPLQEAVEDGHLDPQLLKVLALKQRIVE